MQHMLVSGQHTHGVKRHQPICVYSLSTLITSLAGTQPKYGPGRRLRCVPGCHIALKVSWPKHTIWLERLGRTIAYEVCQPATRPEKPVANPLVSQRPTPRMR